MTLQRPSVRPRLEGERVREVLEVTLELLGEVGYDKLTFDTVAARARASKATLYRRWPSKGHLVAEAMSDLHGEIAEPRTGSLRSDLLAFVGDKRHLDPAEAQLMCGISTAMSTDPELNRALRERFVEPRRAALRRVFEAGLARGEVDEGVDLDLVTNLLPAMTIFCVIVQGQPAPADHARQVVDEVVLPAVRRRTCGHDGR